MPEPDLIQRQREILRVLRRAMTRRAQAKAEKEHGSTEFTDRI